MKKLLTLFTVCLGCLFFTLNSHAQCAADVVWVDVAGPSISTTPIVYCGDELGLTTADTILVPFAVINSDVEVAYDISSDLGVSLVSPLDDGFFTYLAIAQADLDAAGETFTITYTGTTIADCELTLTGNVADLGVTDIAALCSPPPTDCVDGEVLYTFEINGADSGFPNEMSWEVVDADGNVLAGAECDGITGTEVIELCLQDGQTYTFNAYDDWGDGWNGGSYSISTGGTVIFSDSAVSNGEAGDNTDDCVGDDLESSYTFTVGGAIAGCMDPDAFNYNPAATEDDGSCVYECAVDMPWIDAAGPSIADAPVVLCGEDSGITGADTILVAYALINSDFGTSYNITSTAGASLVSPLDNGFFTYLALTADDIAAGGDVTITATDVNFEDCTVSTLFNIADLDAAAVEACLGVIEPTDCVDGEVLYTFTINGEDSGFPNEMSWEVVDADGNVIASEVCGGVVGTAVIEVCLVEGEEYTFNAYDDWGDGWNGGSYSIAFDGTTIFTDNAVTNGEAGDDSDACDGDDLESAYSFIAGSTAIPGCMDPDAFNYNPAATEDDGSCVYECAVDMPWIDAAGPSIADAPVVLCGEDSGITGADTILIAYALINSDFGTSYNITSTAGASLVSPLDDGFFTYLALTADDIAAGGDVTITATDVNFEGCTVSTSFNIADLDAAAVEACLGEVEPLANDECDGAIELVEGLNGPLTNLGANAGNDNAFDGTCFFDNDAFQGTVYYMVTGTGANVTLTTADFDDTENPLSDTQMAVYDACDGALITCNEDIDEAGGNFHSVVSFDTEEGVNYIVLVDGYAGAEGDFLMNVAFEQVIDCEDSDLAITASLVCDIDGNGNNLGFATLFVDEPTGGEGPYDTFISPPGFVYNDGEEYDITVTVIDALGCEASVNLAGVVDCPLPDPCLDSDLLVDVDVICETDEDGNTTGNGILVIDVTGGSGDITVEGAEDGTIIENGAEFFFEIVVTDGLGCTDNVSIEGVNECPVFVPCEIELGDMSQDEQIVCSTDGVFDAISSATLSDDATAFYAIHTSTGADAPGDVLATNETGIFAFDDLDGGEYGQSYFLSFVASDDACGTLFSFGPSVTWVAPIEITVSQDCDENTGGSTFDVIFTITGGLPSVDGSTYFVAGVLNDEIEMGVGYAVTLSDNEPYFLSVNDDLGCIAEAAGAFDPCSKQAIELSNFDGRVEAEGNYIYWTTATEVDNDYFILERSTNGFEFEQVAFVNGIGNSTVSTNYNYTDIDAPVGESLYRLASVDVYGVVSYSDILALNREGILSIDIAPVPAHDNVTITIASAEAATATIEMFDLTGKLINNLDADLVEGANNVNVDVANLAAGVYFVNLTTASNTTTVKLIKE